MPDTDSTGISSTMEDSKKSKESSKSQKNRLKKFSTEENLAQNIRAAGYDISQPSEDEGMLCYPQAEVLAQSHELGTCPPDPRFQQQNVTKWCYRMYIDYKRCAHLLGDGNEYCDYFYKCYHSLCPIAWHTKWDEQIENGTFPRDVTIDMQPPTPKICDRNPYVHVPQPKDDGNNE